MQVDAFLKEHEVYDFTAADFEQDRETLRLCFSDIRWSPSSVLRQANSAAVAVPQALVSQLVLAGVADGRTHR
jgi:hypothetical protein